MADNLGDDMGQGVQAYYAANIPTEEYGKKQEKQRENHLARGRARWEAAACAEAKRVCRSNSFF